MRGMTDSKNKSEVHESQEALRKSVRAPFSDFCQSNTDARHQQGRGKTWLGRKSFFIPHALKSKKKSPAEVRPRTMPKHENARTPECRNNNNMYAVKTCSLVPLFVRTPIFREMSNRQRPPKSLFEWRKVIKHVVHRLTIHPMSFSLLRWRASDTKFRHRYLRRELLRKCPGHFESVRSYSLACHELIWSTVSYHGVQSWRCSNLQCMILREIAVKWIPWLGLLFSRSLGWRISIRADPRYVRGLKNDNHPRTFRPRRVACL